MPEDALRLIIDIQQQASVALGLPEDLNLMTGDPLVDLQRSPHRFILVCSAFPSSCREIGPRGPAYVCCSKSRFGSGAV